MTAAMVKITKAFRKKNPFMSSFVMPSTDVLARSAPDWILAWICRKPFLLLCGFSPLLRAMAAAGFFRSFMKCAGLWNSLHKLTNQKDAATPVVTCCSSFSLTCLLWFDACRLPDLDGKINLYYEWALYLQALKRHNKRLSNTMSLKVWTYIITIYIITNDLLPIETSLMTNLHKIFVVAPRCLLYRRGVTSWVSLTNSVCSHTRWD